MKSERDAQRQRAAVGQGFSASVQRILNTYLTPHRLVVTRARVDETARIVGDELQARLLLKDLVLAVRRPCDDSPVEVSNTGILLVLHGSRAQKWRVLAVIESSVSIHNRHTEVCFWSLALRPTCRFVFVTQDRDVYSARRRSEFGRSCQNSTGARRLLETFTDGVYLAKPYASADDADLQRDLERFHAHPALPAFDAPDGAGHTEYCERVRPLDDLIRDLQRWRHETRAAVDFSGPIPADIAQLLMARRSR